MKRQLIILFTLIAIFVAQSALSDGVAAQETLRDAANSCDAKNCCAKRDATQTTSASEGGPTWAAKLGTLAPEVAQLASQGISNVMHHFGATSETDSTESDEPVLSSKDLVLDQNFPNPVVGSTTIGFSVGKAGVVTLRVCDKSCHQVTVLLEGFVSAGHHSVPFDTHSLPAGLYHYRLEQGNAALTRNLQVVR